MATPTRTADLDSLFRTKPTEPTMPLHTLYSSTGTPPPHLVDQAAAALEETGAHTFTIDTATRHAQQATHASPPCPRPAKPASQWRDLAATLTHRVA